MNIRSVMFCIVAILSAPTLVMAADEGPFLPAPDNAVTEPLASHLRINGVDVRAVQFHVGAEEERLRSYFVEACAKLGGSYTENQLRNEHVQGCITPPYSLTTQWHMEGDSAYGTLSSLRMDQRMEREPLPADLPLPSNASVLQDVETSDAGIHGRVLHIRSNSPAETLRSTLKSALMVRQWQPAPAMRNNPSVISMNKGNRHLDIVIGEDGTDNSRLVLVLDQR